jgi:hypothetical protein
LEDLDVSCFIHRSRYSHFPMARILLGDRELEVVESYENLLQRIAHAESEGPQVGGRPVLPAGWMTVGSIEFGDDIYVQTSAISYVRR